MRLPLPIIYFIASLFSAQCPDHYLLKQTENKTLLYRLIHTAAARFDFFRTQWNFFRELGIFLIFHRRLRQMQAFSADAPITAAVWTSLTVVLLILLQ